jgi:hypothetical protein
LNRTAHTIVNSITLSLSDNLDSLPLFNLLSNNSILQLPVILRVIIVKDTGKVPAWSDISCPRGPCHIGTALSHSPSVEATETVFLILKDLLIAWALTVLAKTLNKIDPRLANV